MWSDYSADHCAFQVDTSKIQEVVKEFERKGGTISSCMPVVAQMLVGAVHGVFEAQGPGWPPFAASTLKGRRGKGNPKLLQDTGVLVGSIRGESGADYAEAGTNVPYVVFHASDAPRRKIPLRNPFDIDQEKVLDDVVSLLLAEIVS
jgi:phage gpG-like protein